MSHLKSPARRRICSGLALTGLSIAISPPSTAAAALPAPVDRIVVLKSIRKLLLVRAGRLIAKFPIALGGVPFGPKIQEGDLRTPEGRYVIDSLNPHSRYHRALHLSYPNTDDLERARDAGVAPGGDIEIHGLPPGYERYNPVAFNQDWTDGCIAVSNRAIDLIWNRVEIATTVDIAA